MSRESLQQRVVAAFLARRVTIPAHDARRWMQRMQRCLDALCADAKVPDPAAVALWTGVWDGLLITAVVAVHLLAGEMYCLVMEQYHELTDAHEEKSYDYGDLSDEKWKEALQDAFAIARKWGGLRDDAEVFFTRMDMSVVPDEPPIFRMDVRAVEPKETDSV